MATYLNKYDYPYLNIHHIIEIDGDAFLLGSRYVWNSTPVVNLYLAKLRSDGVLLWHKEYIFQGVTRSSSPFSQLQFFDLYKINSAGDLLLMARDLDHVLLFKIQSNGNLIWSKKYYDKNDTQLAYNSLYFATRLHKLNEDFSILVITETHSYNGGIRRMDYKFYKINNITGQVADSKTIITGFANTGYMLSIRDQKVHGETLILVGELSSNIGYSGFVFYVDINLNIPRSHNFIFDGELEGLNYLMIFELSRIQDNQFAVLGEYFGDGGKKIFISEFFYDTLTPVNGVHISSIYSYLGAYGDIEKQIGGGYLFHRGTTCYSVDNSFNVVWMKEMSLTPTSEWLTIKNIEKSFIYSKYDKGGPQGYSVVSKSLLDFEGCKTSSVEPLFNFIEYPLIHKEYPLTLQPFSPILYPSPNIALQNLAITEYIEVCESGEDNPEPDPKQSNLYTKSRCILPNGTSKALVVVRLYDNQGSPISGGGDSVQIFSSIGNMGLVQDHNNGVYTAYLTSTVTGNANLTFSVNGQQGAGSANISISKECGKAEPNARLSTISSSNPCVRPSTKPGAPITIQLFDNVGNPITTGGDNIQAYTTLGSISSITDNGDGTYSAYLYSGFPGVATVSFSVNGVLSPNTLSVTVSKHCGIEEEPSLKYSTITASPICIAPKEQGQSTITVRLFDQNGNPILNGGYNVAIHTTSGTITNFTDHGNGTYTATLISGPVGGAYVSFSINGQQWLNMVWVKFSEKCDIHAADGETSLIKANPHCIKPDGQDHSKITIYLRDSSGNPILTGGDTVFVQTNLGSLTGVVDNNDGTYTTYLTSTMPGQAILTFYINGLSALDYETVFVSRNCGIEPDLKESSITAVPTCIKPDGTQQSSITVQLVDNNGNPMSMGGYNVWIQTNLGNITITTDNGNGTYTALLSSNAPGTATVSFGILGNNSPNTATVTFSDDCEKINGIDLEASTIVAVPNFIANTGTDISVVKVQLVDFNGNAVPSGSYAVVIHTNFGTIGLTYLDPSSGTYKANLTGTSIGTATVGFSINGNNSPNTDTVQITDEGGGGDEGTDIPSTGETMLQSPNFYLQAVGSKGNESAKGVHLRWIFRGSLGELHLPKRNYATTQANFNKPNDVVNVYRTKYRKVAFILNLAEESGPNIIDNNHRVWIYRPEGKEFYVHFRNTSKYDSVRNGIDPATDPIGFLTAYGSELIEVENKIQLFFAARLIVSNPTGSSSVKAETLSVGGNALLADKIVSSRQIYNNTQLSQMRMVCENGRSVRYRGYDCIIDQIEFEFYVDFLEEINSQRDWHLLNDYALSLDNTRVFKELEPVSGSVNTHWQRFNDNDCVNVDNYQDKWNGNVEPGDRNIREVVEKYIQLSDNVGNPTAIEAIPFNNGSGDTTDIAHLNLLNFASHDYHVARMLGLGTLDLNSQVFNDSYVYIAEYITFGNLQDGNGAREVQHLSMSLPTALSDERLPLSIDLKELVPGVFYGYGGEPQNLVDEEGYGFDGKTRYISIFSKALQGLQANLPFFASQEEFSAEKFTFPIYAGLEHKMDSETEWEKPELSNDPDYQNVLSSGAEGKNETLPILLPDQNKPLYVHAQKKSGWHRYAAYAINWFFRATNSEIIESIYTDLKPTNKLLPPSNIQPFLIRQEEPPMFTSVNEQERVDAITGADKTLVRLLFDYNSFQELIRYSIPANSSIGNSQYENDPDLLYPDADEVFAEDVEIYFRGQVPRQVAGKALDVNPHPSNPLLAIIKTGPFDMGSSGETPTEQIVPTINPGNEPNFIGATFTIGQQHYIIHEVNQTGNGPDFVVYKKEISDAITADIPSPDIDPDNLVMPELTEDGFFMAVENMQDKNNWGTPNPSSFKVQIGDNWSVHREIFEIINPGNGSISRELEKTRGIWSNPALGGALIENELEPEAVLDANGDPQYDANGNLITQDVHKGLYKITFHGVQLDHHPQAGNTPGQLAVEWSRGIARVFTESAVQGGTPVAKRKVLKVETITNIGDPSDLVIYAQDPTFSDDIVYDAVKTGNNLSVNYYPAYKVYLYADSSMGLSEENTLPVADEDLRYSVFGLRSHDHDYNYFSKMSLPGLLFAQRIVIPLPPEQPEGALYATRPDFFGRSTYTLTTEYQHKPYGVLFHRASDEGLLNALYEKDTVLAIRGALKTLGGSDEEYFTNRWQNFVNFDELIAVGDFKVYPPEGVSSNGYKFPNPDKQALFDWANQILEDLGQSPINGDPGDLAVGDPQLIEFVKGAIYNVFVPLTELPIIYQYIKGGNYEPVDKKQNIKDRNGYALSPTDPEFEMAPMMKIIDTDPHKTQFTDFKLDGYSNNFYFYGVKEMGSQMKIGEFGPFLGPIKLVNTNAPEAPEIKNVVPQLENPVLGTLPAIIININAYPKVQEIRKISLYRAFGKLDAQSIRSMQLAKSIIIDEEMLTEPVWSVVDDFQDLQEVPYGDGLYYRVIVGRKVEYADKNNNLVSEHAPSKPSKMIVSMVAETANPPAPVLEYTSDSESGGVLPNVVLSWDKTCYNGKYYLYKMNSQGNWVKIHNIQSNDETIILDLANTDLGTNDLDIVNSDGNFLYHHFKVVAENTAGMLSTEENMLTIPNS